ncbi:MAG: NAD(P)/FAD-dependent oxidoreductase [Thermomicrobiales bacterium]
MTERKRIAIVGGGIAGLTAALRLAQSGHEVTLWERAPKFGGQAGAFEVEGGKLEYFYHHLFQSDTQITELIQELGIGDRLAWLPSNVGYFADGTIYPLNGAKDLLTLPILPFHDRIRVGLVTAYLQRVKNWKPYEQVTAKQWLTRAMGERAYSRTFGAQLDAKFGRYADQIAMVWFWGKIWLRTTSRRSPLEGEKLGYPIGSFDVVIDAIVEGARNAGATLISGVGPSELEKAADGSWIVRIDGQDDQTFDAVIGSVPSPIFAKLVPQLPEDYRAKLLALDYEAAVVVLLEMDRALSDVYWMNIADPSMPFTAIIEHTNFVAPGNYNGRHYVYLSKYLEPDNPYFTMPDTDVIDAYLPHLRKVNKSFEKSWISNYWVFRERAAQPIITLNYSERLPDHRTPLSGLYLANTSQIYPEDRGTNYSVRLGNDIAAMVKADLA